MWLVPALRFPEFTEEWEEHYLAEYLDFKNGLNPSANKFGSGIKFISVMDILNNDFITYDCIRTSVEITPEEQVAFAVEKGDMLFQRSSETLEDVGRANVYMDDRPAVFGGFVIRGKKKAEYNPMFFRYLLASPYARKKVIPMGAGAQHFNIGQDGLSKVKLHFPILQEQQKIADLLRLINERISTQNKMIKAKKQETLIDHKNHNFSFIINSTNSGFTYVSHKSNFPRLLQKDLTGLTTARKYKHKLNKWIGLGSLYSSSDDRIDLAVYHNYAWFNDPVMEKTSNEVLEASGVMTTSSGHKIGRNDPCPCNSGKKYKKCCGAAK